MAGDNPNFPISTASVSWVDSGGQVQLRIYTCDGYTVIDRCFDGSWTTGQFKQAGSAVSATCWQASGASYIRVYCTNDDSTVEWCSDAGGAWYQGGFTT